jgi:hypothetical protein
MIRAIEIGRKRTRSMSRPTLLGREVVICPAAQCVISCVEALNYASVCRRILSIISVCSSAWLASIWLAATIAQAHEPACKGASLTATEPVLVHRSIEKRDAPHPQLSMVDRSDREPEALRNSAVHSSNPLPMDAQSAGEARLPSNPQGAEFASLAALASAPPSSL